MLKIFIGYYVIIAILFIIENLDISIEAAQVIKNRNMKLKKDKTIFSRIIGIAKLFIYSILPIFRLFLIITYWAKRDEIIENTVDKVIKIRGVED